MIKLKYLFVFLLFFNFYFVQSSFAQNTPVPFETVEVKPKFPGGLQALNNFVNSNYVIPDVDGISGVVKISFVVEMNGTLSGFKVIQDLGEASANEAKRVFAKLPFWEAGIQNGEKVRVLVIFPISINQ
jgi:Gram-negative bacterial TonB protein C-terminal